MRFRSFNNRMTSQVYFKGHVNTAFDILSHSDASSWSHHPKWAEIQGGWLLTRESLPKLLL